MKKFLIVLFVGLLFLSGCSKKEEAEGAVTFLTLDEYKEKIASDDKFAVVIGNVDCSACQMFKPVLQEINKNKGVEIFYVQIDNSKWSTDEKTELLSITKEAYGFDIAGTPTTFIVENKEMKEAIVGYKEYSEILEIFIDHGIVKK